MCINWLSVNTVSMNWSCFHYTVVCAPVSNNDLKFLGSNILKREKISYFFYICNATHFEITDLSVLKEKGSGRVISTSAGQ